MNWWQQRQKRDVFVKKRDQGQWRSRAAFKLEEIYERFLKGRRLTGPLCDLGCAPGSWAQILLKRYPDNKIVGCDLLSCSPLKNFVFIQGDFCDSLIQQQIIEHANGQKFALITSDIAPSIDGNRLKEQAFFKDLSVKILELAQDHLRPHGYVIQKVFQGDEFEEIYHLYRCKASKVDTFKPRSSRSESREVFIVAKF